MVCRDIEYFQQEAATIWPQKTGIFFPPRWYSTPCDSGDCLYPPPLHCCVLMPLLRKQPLSIVRKYKRRSLEVQISGVALWAFWSTQRRPEKWNIFKENVVQTKECQAPKKSLKNPPTSKPDKGGRLGPLWKTWLMWGLVTCFITVLLRVKGFSSRSLS